MRNILFRCDSSSTIGLGHIKRCLVLAHRIKKAEKDVKIFFITQNLAGNINHEITQDGFGVVNIKKNEELSKHISLLNANTVIIDSYEIDSRFEKKLKKRFPHVRLICFDDTYQKHHCDIVINHAISAKKEWYKNITPPFCKILCGNKYTLLRDEFFEQKKVKVKKNNIAIILGGNDTKNLSLKIAKIFLKINKKYRVSVLTTSSNPNIVQLLQNRNIKTLIDKKHIAKTLCQHEIVVCGSGGTLFEVMALKKRFINIELVDNQKNITNFLKQKNIYTTLKATNINKNKIKERIMFIKKSDIYKKIKLNFSKNHICESILK